MSTRNLEYLFRPRSIAVIGASNRTDSVGATVIRNLLKGPFAGPVLPVNPKYQSIGSVLCYPNVAELPVVPDLAVICTPARVIPDLIAELGQRGTRAAIVCTADLALEKDDSDRTFEPAVLEAARPYRLRILGPDSLGLLVPHLGLNASFATVDALSGKIAFAHQSGMLCTALLDWARSNGIGFSNFISLGKMMDVDFGDVLDYLASDPDTRAILLHIEAIRGARKFMSAARAAARTKPVLVIKTGRTLESARLLGVDNPSDDAVFDAAIRRAGMLRVFTTDEMFDALETLAYATPPIRSDRLAIISNGIGPTVLATDDLIVGGGQLAKLSEETITKLKAILPPSRSLANPVQLVGNSPEPLYGKALEIVLDDPQVAAVLVLHAPHTCVSSEQVARAVIEVAGQSRKSVLTSWLGGELVKTARRLFAEAGMPTYATPDKAIRAFLHRVRYQRNQELLMETPPSVPTEFTPHLAQARAAIDRALKEGRLILDALETQAVLAAYGIPVVKSCIAKDAEEAARAATEIGFPVAIQVLSPSLGYRSQAGGVIPYQETAEAVRDTVAAIQNRLAALRPDATVLGFAVQEMVHRPIAQELLVQVKSDPIFGPVIIFGQGGKAAEGIADRAVTLPPLNLALARDLIARTRIGRLLQSGIEPKGSPMPAIEMTLLQIAQLVIDLPEVIELTLNPLLADHQGVLALDTRIALQASAAAKAERLAIRPYPKELEESIVLPAGRQVRIRPIRPEDEARLYAFRRQLTPEDLYYRFFHSTRWDIPHSQMARLTQIDYDREMALIATAPDEQGEEEILGIVRTITDPDNLIAEMAIIVRSDLKGQELGRELLERMIAYCRNRGTREMVGYVLPENYAMQEFAGRLGFELRFAHEQEVFEIRLGLAS